MRSEIPAILMCLLSACGFGDVVAQPVAQPMQISLGFGVDTGQTRAWGDFSWRDPVAEIVRNWRSYLVALGNAQTGQAEATRYWSEAERRQWPAYDLAQSSAYLIGSATILDVRPLRAGDTTDYLVETLFARADSGRGATAQRIRPIAMTRVAAVKENGRWVFANMLPRLTQHWKRERVGSITYVIEPGYVFQPARARTAVQFADSLAHAFGVPALKPLTYYLTSTPDAMNRLMGLDWSITYGGHGGGRADYRNGLIFSGDPIVGENYRHELTHFVLAPLSPAGGSNAFLLEGVATWLGGTLGMTPNETQRAFAEFLRNNPSVTLDSAFLSSNRDQGFRPGGAVLSGMVFARNGTAGIRELLGVLRSADVEPVIERLLNMPWADVRNAWRTQALTGGTTTR